MAKSHAIQNREPRPDEDLVGKVCICQQNQIGLVCRLSGGIWEGVKLLEPGLWQSTRPKVAFDELDAAYAFVKHRIREERIKGKPGLLRLTCGSVVRYVKNLVLEDDKSLGVNFVNDGHDDLFDQGFAHAALKQFGLRVEATETADVPSDVHIVAADSRIEHGGRDLYSEGVLAGQNAGEASHQ